MPATDNAQPPSEPPSRQWLPSANLSLGIAPRLAFAFVAVTVLAVTANLVAEHGTSIIETTEFAISGRAPAPPTLPAPPAPLRAKPAQAPLPSVAAAPTTFLPAFEQADRALRDRLNAADADHRADWEQSLKELTRQAATLPPAPAGTGVASGSDKAAARVHAYLHQAVEAIQLADTRRSLVEDYRQKQTALQTMVTQAIDHGWKVFGRLIARQSLVDLSRDLQSIQDNSETLTASFDTDATAVEASSLSETEFASDLKNSRNSLQRSQSNEWESRLSADFDTLVSDRIALTTVNEKLRGAVTQLTRERGRIIAIVRASLKEAAAHERPSNVRPPAATLALGAPILPSQSLPETRVERRVISKVATPEDLSARKWVVWITVGVLASLLATSISTIVSIVRPVRRLMTATRRLSTGGAVQVARGGIKELDVLAVAFNDMAQQLVTAREAADAYQVTLEQRVQERTRALQHLAEHDSLTQLPNRRLLLERLGHALQSATDSGQRVGVFFLDLDNFKNINDGMGHSFGDSLLLSVAQRLSETAAAFGFAARLGGDEFTIIYPGAPSVEAIAEAGAAILRAFHKPLAVEKRELTVSVSVGASIFPDHEMQAEPLLRAADAALFRAKALGRSQLNLFSPDLVEAALSKFVIEQGLRRAVDLGEFELVFQPEVNLGSLEPTLVEALVRWRTPDGQFLAPDAFFSVAEESGLIVELSDWVLRTAIAAAANWHHGAWPNARVAINVSPRQLLDPKFVDRVEDLLRQSRLPARCIEIELTENVLQTGATTIAALRRLRTCGIAIALDDFGTGYSSFASLEVLPLTRVKLDRSLIAGIDTRPGSQAIANAIIGLCLNLGLEITAEGVERPEQLAMLSRNSATHIQGYLVSRPLSADRLLAELAAIPAHMESLLLTMPVPVTAAEPFGKLAYHRASTRS